MASTAANPTRTVTITLPEDVALVAEQSARDQRVEVSEVISRAIRADQRRWQAIEAELNSPIDPSNPASMTLAQVNDLVHETRRSGERKSA